jgi:hypothetical protein
MKTTEQIRLELGKGAAVTEIEPDDKMRGTTPQAARRKRAGQ